MERATAADVDPDGLVDALDGAAETGAEGVVVDDADVLPDEQAAVTAATSTRSPANGRPTPRRTDRGWNLISPPAG
ncbi:hypothetical protein [Acidothermus cellulolyticus]|uniref:hypothetical protein n=1 Tax=Acidothermus cellulolyticus TaxID=28049 RepID=UPI0002FBF49D|nr:hypothetical protein [Acidothermus cellulolyticus]